jgi:hypothetical protein
MLPARRGLCESRPSPSPEVWTLPGASTGAAWTMAGGVWTLPGLYLLTLTERE